MFCCCLSVRFCWSGGRFRLARVFWCRLVTFPAPSFSSAMRVTVAVVALGLFCLSSRGCYSFRGCLWCFRPRAAYVLCGSLPFPCDSFAARGGALAGVHGGAIAAGCGAVVAVSCGTDVVVWIDATVVSWSLSGFSRASCSVLAGIHWLGFELPWLGDGGRDGVAALCVVTIPLKD
eukprot:IDg2124t1